MRRRFPGNRKIAETARNENRSEQSTSMRIFDGKERQGLRRQTRDGVCGIWSVLGAVLGRCQRSPGTAPLSRMQASPIAHLHISPRSTNGSVCESSSRCAQRGSPCCSCRHPGSGDVAMPPWVCQQRCVGAWQQQRRLAVRRQSTERSCARLWKPEARSLQHPSHRHASPRSFAL